MTLGCKRGIGSEEEEEGVKERLGVLGQGVGLGGRSLSNSLNDSPCDSHLQQL